MHLKASSDIVLASIDPECLKSALLNLTSNAIQAMPQGGELCIEIAESAHEAMIKVSDTGEGIPKENLSKIFTPLFTTRPEGHGFGLTEVHTIVHALHGEIELFSKVGIGTTFVIHLPKVENAAIALISSKPLVSGLIILTFAVSKILYLRNLQMSERQA